VLDKIFDTISRETRSATAKRMGAILKIPYSIAFEVQASADPDVTRQEETYFNRAMLQMISDLRNQLASITCRLDSDVGIKRGAEPEMMNLEKNQPPDENIAICEGVGPAEKLSHFPSILLALRRVGMILTISPLTRK